MSRTSLLVALAALATAALAAPAQARPVSFGSSSAGAAPSTCESAINQIDCTVIGQVVPATGRLTTVSIGHDAAPSGASLKLKLFRHDSASDNYYLVRDIGTNSVAAGSETTEWTGLVENVTQGQVLGYFVDNSGSSQLAVTSMNSGNGIGIYGPGEVDDTSTSWPYALLTSWGARLRGIVRTPPVTTIDSGPSGFTQSTTASFSYSADESPVTFQCSLDGGAYASCPAGGYSGLSEGAHTFSVRAVNDIDQTGAAATRTFTVDHTAPNTLIASGPNGVQTSDPRPTFTFSSTEGGTFECKLDGGAFIACSSPTRPASELADGQHTLQVRSIDEAGNVDQTPAVATFTVKRSAPPAPPRWGINLAGKTWTFSDRADSRGGAATDIESARLVYDSAGRFGVLVRFYGAGAHKVWVDLHRSADCTDYAKELWVSAEGDQYDIWATASMTASEFVGGRTSDDGREILVTIEDPRIAGLALRCLKIRSVAGSEDVDTLTASLVGPSPRRIVVIMRQSLAPIVRVLAKRSPAELARKRVHKLYLSAPAAGSVGIEWSVSRAIAKRHGVRVRRGVKKVTLALGSKSVTRKAKKVPVKVKLSPAGKQVLRKATKLKMQVRSGYLARGGDKLLAAMKSVQLASKKKK